MKRTVTRLLVGCVLVALLGAGAAVLGVRAMRAQPSWYVDRVAALAEAPPAPEESSGGLLSMLGGLLGIDTRHASSLLEQLQELATTGRVELDAARLAAILETSMSSTADGRAVLATMTDPMARIADGAIEFGGTVHLDSIDTASLPGDAGAAVQRLRRWLPGLSDRELYVGLRTVPHAEDGDLIMSGRAALVVGRLAIPGWLIPAGELREQLDLDLRAVELTRAEVVGSLLVLEAGPEGGP